MLTLYFDLESKQPKYEQRYRYIKKEIESGHLTMNEKLPSKRSLANHLTISIITVETAYQLLQAEGYIRSEERSGYFVDTTPFPKRSSTEKKPFFPSTDKELSVRYDFRTNVMEPSLFPYSIWAKLSRSVLSQSSYEAMHHHQHPQGILDLRQAIAHYLYRFRGMTVLPEQIVIGSGSEQLYRILIDLFGRQFIYGTENPGYPKIQHVIELSGATHVDLSLDEHGINLESLEKSNAEVVFLTPNHQFPTGIVMPIKRRIDVLKWVMSSSRRYIVEGDYDSELTDMNQPIPTLQTLDHQQKVIYINTFSKTIAPVLRVAYMILPIPLLKKYHQYMALGPCPVPLFDQMILMKFIEEGYFERHINRMRQIYKKRKECLIKALIEAKIVQKDQIFDTGSGLHLLINIRILNQENAMIKAAYQHGVKVYGLNEFIRGKTKLPQTYLLLGFSGMDEASIQEAIGILAVAWEPFKSIEKSHPAG